MRAASRPPQPVSNERIVELTRLYPTLCFERTPQGALSVAPPTGFNTEDRNTDLVCQLRNWNSRAKLGVVCGSGAGFDLPTGALYAPDASWTAKERIQALTHEEREKFAPLCPDVVFELRSKSDSPARLGRKLRDYLNAGAKLAVLIDPYRRTVEVLFAGEEPRTHAHPTKLRFISSSGNEPLPAFELDPQPIFAIS